MGAFQVSAVVPSAVVRRLAVAPERYLKSNGNSIRLQTMTQELGYIALVVRDYDEAIAFYTQSLGFLLI